MYMQVAWIRSSAPAVRSGSLCSVSKSGRITRSACSVPSVVDGLHPDRKDLRPFLGLAWPIGARKKQRGLIANFQKSDYPLALLRGASSWQTREHQHAFGASRLEN